MTTTDIAEELMADRLAYALTQVAPRHTDKAIARAISTPTNPVSERTVRSWRTERQLPRGLSFARVMNLIGPRLSAFVLQQEVRWASWLDAHAMADEARKLQAEADEIFAQADKETT